MKSIYIWGAGYYIQQVVEEIDTTKTHIIGILDNDKKKQGKKIIFNIPIISPSEILKRDFDYIVIAVKNHNPIERECERMGITRKKVIVYWQGGYNECIFKSHTDRIEELMRERKHLQNYIDSIPYEWGVKKVPEIRTGIELLKKIIKDHTSLCRFGDGEYEMIRMQERPWFQKPNSTLSKRLREVLSSEDELINIAIAQNFTGLEQYKEDFADEIRKYMYGDTRDYILKLINQDRIYYDAYVTRPYIMYKEKENADIIFALFKELWKNRDLVIIEGKYSRIGVGNNMMEEAASIRRISCPYKDAWDKYEEILNTILASITKDDLICISLGPCATVLAYDLAKKGYQALDIGQLDNEYEWYLRNANERIEITGKLVAELLVEQKLELIDEKAYIEQVIAEII